MLSFLGHVYLRLPTPCTRWFIVAPIFSRVLSLSVFLNTPSPHHFWTACLQTGGFRVDDWGVQNIHRDDFEIIKLQKLSKVDDFKSSGKLTIKSLCLTQPIWSIRLLYPRELFHLVFFPHFFLEIKRKLSMLNMKDWGPPVRDYSTKLDTQVTWASFFATGAIWKTNIFVQENIDFEDEGALPENGKKGVNRGPTRGKHTHPMFLCPLTPTLLPRSLHTTSPLYILFFWLHMHSRSTGMYLKYIFVMI